MDKSYSFTQGKRLNPSKCRFPRLTEGYNHLAHSGRLLVKHRIHKNLGTQTCASQDKATKLSMQPHEAFQKPQGAQGVTRHRGTQRVLYLTAVCMHHSHRVKATEGSRENTDRVPCWCTNILPSGAKASMRAHCFNH